MSADGPEIRRWVGEAPAKVNLFLRVLDREPSGYHRIETVFQALELSDRVTMEVSGRNASPESRADSDWESPAIELQVEGVGDGALGPPESNLAYRAAARFQDEMRRRGLPPPAFRITLEKRIPHGAGLGGGSSDAATVLLGANLLAGDPLTQEDLLRIGGELGADVPFFLIGAARARGSGRGEILTPLPPLSQREVLLLVPGEGINTGWAYGVLAEVRQRTGWRSTSEPTAGLSPSSEAPEAGADWERVAAVAANDFEAVLFPLRSELGELKNFLLRCGASFALLSGSGAVVFAVFSNADALESASREAERYGVQVIRTRTLASSG